MFLIELCDWKALTILVTVKKYVKKWSKIHTDFLTVTILKMSLIWFTLPLIITKIIWTIDQCSHKYNRGELEWFEVVF